MPALELVANLATGVKKDTSSHWLIGGQSLLRVQVAWLRVLRRLQSWNILNIMGLSSRFQKFSEEKVNWSGNTAWKIIDGWPTDYDEKQLIYDAKIPHFYICHPIYILWLVYTSCEEGDRSYFCKSDNNCMTFLTSSHIVNELKIADFNMCQPNLFPEEEIGGKENQFHIAT